MVFPRPISSARMQLRLKRKWTTQGLDQAHTEITMTISHFYLKILKNNSPIVPREHKPI